MEGVNATIKKGPGLYEFLAEAELSQYFNSFKNTLKIAHPSQLKFTTESDLLEIGMSKPEMRRLRKYYEKHFPHNYLSKLKKIINLRKGGQSSSDPFHLTHECQEIKSPKASNKHIIPAASITINKELGMGEFGVVQQGVWCNEGERIQVAIKCLSRDRMQSNMVEFLKEASIMHNIDHPNIVRFFGVVLPNIEGSLMLVTELAPLRSLLECLKEPSLRSSFPVLTLCDFAYQICDGMQYLEANRLIHRDLAARNILVFSKNKVKISDFGLSRALGQGKDYYQTNFNVNLKLPIAWCAPECISYLRFTTSSDVWAFGVTLWEMFSYGFQPWAALTGQQILEAIDEPNLQRLEQPDCCPLDHYVLMLDCWRHEASTRPRFAEIGPILAECRPEQVQAKSGSESGPHMLCFKAGDVVTVLDKKTHHPLWKGITANGKTGLFDPINVVAYLGSDLPSSSFHRTDSTRSSTTTTTAARRSKLRSEMISGPQGDFKHTGHVGLDGAFFGDLSFLGGSKGNYGSVPTQVVAPYRPHKDQEAAPLLSEGDGNNHVMMPGGGSSASLQDHEYHEISDDEDDDDEYDLAGMGGENNTNLSSPTTTNLDFGASLLAEIDNVLSSYGNSSHTTTGSSNNNGHHSHHSALDHHEGSNRSNELREKMNTAAKSRKQATVKPISAHDSKTLDTAIALANEISTRSLSAPPPAPTTPASPGKKKFSFKFPSVGVGGGSGGGGGGDQHGSSVDKTVTERRNFSEEALAGSDLQSKVTQEAQMAYQALVESPTSDVVTSQMTQFMVSNPLKLVRMGQVPIKSTRTRSASVASSLPTRLHDSVRNSVPENLNGTKTDFSSEDLAAQKTHQNISGPFATINTRHYNFRHHSLLEPASPSYRMGGDSDNNPIPLPPRDRNKALLQAKPRHTRKHPLIIPLTNLQRTLDKVTTITPPLTTPPLSAGADGEQEDPFFPTQTQRLITPIDSLLHHHVHMHSINGNQQQQQQQQVPRLVVASDKNPESLNFEAQIESNLDALDEIPVLQEHDVVDGIMAEGFGNTLKIDEDNKVSSHHVSCEDLLKFANTKPSSRARGNDSDEVRIMLKVLGKDVPTEKCIEALDQSEWDFMKAIKIVKLQKMVNTDMKSCFDALENTSWDVAKAAQWILQQDGEVTQV